MHESVRALHEQLTLNTDLYLSCLAGLEDGEAERVVGLAFQEGYPDEVKLTTKCMLGDTPAVDVESVLVRSLDESCKRLGRDSVDVYILHGYVIEDGWVDATRPKLLPHIAIPYSRFESHVVPTFEKLKAAGRIGAWGVTAASTQNENFRVIDAAAKPDVVQCVTNLLDSPGGMAISREKPDPRAVIQRAAERGIGVMGIRAVAAGSLVDALDRSVSPNSAEQRDYDRAAGFREIAEQTGSTPASMPWCWASKTVASWRNVWPLKRQERWTTH